MYEFFIVPFQFDFMQRALLAAVLAAIVASVVGVYVVLRGLAFMGDAVAHSSLLGMAVAVRMGGSVLWGAFAWAIPASILITFISRRGKFRLDTSIGIIYAFGFSTGIIIISTVSGYSNDLFSFLFGDVLGVSWREVIVIGIVTVIVIGTIALFYKELLFTSYDDSWATVVGVPVRLIQYLLPLLVGITTVAAVKAVGIVLVLSLLITPAATARLLVRRFRNILGVSTILGVSSVIGGLYLSFHLDWPPGATIVLFETGLFALVFAVYSVKNSGRFVTIK